MRSRKTGNVTMLSYLSSSFMYTKLANLILWFNADYLMGIIYGVLFVRKYPRLVTKWGVGMSGL